MGNPVREATIQFIARLGREKPDVLRRARRDVEENSAWIHGTQLSLIEELYLIKSVKWAAAIDGLSAVEERGLDLMLARWMAPPEIIQHIQDFDPSTIHYQEIAELVEPGSDKARGMLSDAVFVALLDDLSKEEYAACVKLAERLGFPAGLVEVFIARARLEIYAANLGDNILQQLVSDMTRSLWSLQPGHGR